MVFFDVKAADVCFSDNLYFTRVFTENLLVHWGDLCPVLRSKKNNLSSYSLPLDGLRL